MSLKEKVREYQKRREAKKYFRSQNQYVIHGKDLPKYIAAIVVALGLLMLGLAEITKILGGGKKADKGADVI